MVIKITKVGIIPGPYQILEDHNIQKVPNVCVPQVKVEVRV